MQADLRSRSDSHDRARGPGFRPGAVLVQGRVVLGRVALGWVALTLLACGRPGDPGLRQENERLTAEIDSLHTQLEELEERAVDDPDEDDPTGDDSTVQAEVLAMVGSVTLANTVQHPLTRSDGSETFQIKIWHPRSSPEPGRRYPVLLVLDAETNFGGVSYITQRLLKDELIPPLLLVGVAYDTGYETFYDLRSRDLTPTHDPDFRWDGRGKPSGEADRFLDFLEHRLLPFVAEHYPVDLDDVGIYGHSFGGLFGAHALLERPQLFRRYLVLSPSLWWHDRVLFDRLGATRFEPLLGDGEIPPRRIYFAAGELEARIARQQTAFVEPLEAALPSGTLLRAEVLGDETHRTIFGRGFTNGLRFLYDD